MPTQGNKRKIEHFSLFSQAILLHELWKVLTERQKEPNMYSEKGKYSETSISDKGAAYLMDILIVFLWHIWYSSLYEHIWPY